MKTIKIYYDNLNQLVNFQTNKVIFDGKNNGKISLEKIINGDIKWDNGKTEYTIHDFIGDYLGIQDYIFVG